MTMTATVLRVDPQRLLVRNEENGEEVLVHFRNADRFSAGDRVFITFSGRMTLSIPPQITATSIQRVRPAPTPTHPQSRPSEMRATILQTGRRSLLVLRMQDREQIRVEYPYAHHFCARQQVVIRYDTITMDRPPRVTAVDIIPIC